MIIIEFIYSIFILALIFVVKISSRFNAKIKLLNNGQKNWKKRLETDFNNVNEKVVWIHCSSLGEFEQGRPIIEALKHDFPNVKILLTFFSPSGYEVRKNYQGVDWTYYLPFDTKKNAKAFIEIVKPQIAIFVKYEYWFYYLKTLNKKNIPVIMISALFQKRQVFFKWYGGFHRKMLHFITHFFVQNKASKDLLNKLSIDKVSIVGDTRVDRALTISEKAKDFPIIKDFKKESLLIIAGSTWKVDEILLFECLAALKKLDIKLIIAPHEIHTAHIEEIEDRFKIFKPSRFTSGIIELGSKVLIVDTIGQLSEIYSFADYCWIGGGFNKTGIHNSIEAAVYNKSLLWGPNYQRYQEAIDLINLGVAMSFENSHQLKDYIQESILHPEIKKIAEQKAQQYIVNSKGATEKIIQFIKQQNIFL
ncbi:MAG TPA: glycosyltransferase N-terminal domain-containing protein [Edaphocola sp.]|nr:glycosyltransferase N-terminal domain-containing protein [Edaphocola sp.]